MYQVKYCVVIPIFTNRESEYRAVSALAEVTQVVSQQILKGRCRLPFDSSNFSRFWFPS